MGAIRRRAREDAQEVLDRVWRPYVFPVDPVAVARSLGVSVISAQLDDDVWGMLVGGKNGADIYLDKDQPPARFRFSCAHEIGHYYLRAEQIAQGAAFIDARSDEDKGTADEVYANEFAGSLLMPAAALLAAVERETDFELMQHFGVSFDALKYRRYILGF